MRYPKPKQIMFKWRNTVFQGDVLEQQRHEKFEKATLVRTVVPFPFTFLIYGKCELGQCGQFNIIVLTF